MNKIPEKENGCVARQNSHSHKTIFYNNLVVHSNGFSIQIQAPRDLRFICFLTHEYFITKTFEKDPSFDVWLYIGNEQCSHSKHFRTIDEAAKYLEKNVLVVDLMQAYQLLNRGAKND